MEQLPALRDGGSRSGRSGIALDSGSEKWERSELAGCELRSVVPTSANRGADVGHGEVGK